MFKQKIACMVIFLISVLFFNASLMAETVAIEVSERQDVEIETIELVGLRIWSPEDVRSLLEEAGLQEGEQLPAEVLEHRVDRALRILTEEGLFSDVRARKRDGELTFEFEEYSSVVNIEFRGNEAFDDQRLQDVILLQRGEPANPYKIRQARRDLADYYNMMGYGRVRITSEVEETQTGRAVIVFELDETSRQVIDGIVYEFVEEGLFKRIRRRWGLGWAIPIKEGDPYSARRVDMAKNAITNWYHNRGHMDVEVESKRFSAPGEGVEVRFIIREGPVYRTGEFSFSGNELYTDEEVRGMIPLAEERVFNRGALIEGLQKIEHAYQDRGYANARVLAPGAFQIHKDPVELVVNVAVDIFQGQPFYVERLEIHGNQRTYDKVIRREINLHSGDLLDGEKLRNAQRRLRNLGFFKGVDFNIDPGTRDNEKIIRVRVEEGPTGQLQFGGGYSSSIGFVGNFEVKKDNFSLYDYDEAFTGRGQSISTNFQFGSTQDRYSISWDDPWFNDNLDKPDRPSPERPIGLGWSAFNIVNEREDGYDETRRGGAVRIGREFGAARSNKIDLEYSYRIIDVSDIDKTDTEDLPRDIYEEWENDGKDPDGFTRKISSLELGLQRDRRDHRLYPSEGYFLRASTEMAGDFIGGNANYYRPRLDLRGYLPFWGPFGWALRADYRTIDTWKDLDKDNPIPSFEKFYLGGFRNVRGYGFRDIRLYDGEEDLGGGYSSFFANLEFRAELVEQTMQVFAFTDVGKVYEDSWEFGSDDIYRSAGMGFRIYSPIGPLILSWARRLNETYEGAGDKGDVHVDFNIGGAF